MKTGRIGLCVCTLLIMSVAVTSAEAPRPDNAIAQRLSEIEDGKLHIVYETREGVWGDGKDMISFADDDHHRQPWNSHRRLEPGPVRILFTLHDGEITHLKTRVGGNSQLSDRVEDMGNVDSRDAAAALLWIADTGRGDVAEDAIAAAVLAADVELWEDLLAIARDRGRHNGVREQAIFWLGQEAGEKVVQELGEIVTDDDEDLEIREHAIFALSQRPDDESVPALIRVATTNDHPELRKNALFWLAQHDDERVLDLFEEILQN
jgi:hypothetical protein